MKIYKYTEVAEYKAALYLRLNSLDEFSRFLDHHQYKQLLLLPADKGSGNCFAVIHDGALIVQEAKGFQALEDYHAAVKANFTDAKRFYEALAIGCKTFEEYDAAMKSGTHDLKLLAKMRQAGFIEGFTGFTEMKKTAVVSSIPADNAVKLYNWAMAAHFTCFKEFKEAIEKGFTDANVYKVAMEKSYSTAEEFIKGNEGKYLDAAEFREAQKVGARDRDDYAHYHELMLLNLPELKDDEKTVIVVLSKLPQHKKVSVNKFKELVTQQAESYRYPDTNEMPSWYAAAFSESYTLTDFLQKNDEARKYGQYDKDGEYFETRRLQERKIVVDGSNAAYPMERKVGEKPRISNIMRVVNALKERGFTEIIVMSDASLIHVIADGEKLAELKEMVTYIQTPAGKSADMFMIDYVKIHRCLLLSNDTFRDWKLNEAWVAENIDYYRLSFVVNDDTVLLPDLEMEKMNQLK